MPAPPAVLELSFIHSLAPSRSKAADGGIRRKRRLRQLRLPRRRPQIIWGRTLSACGLVCRATSRNKKRPFDCGAPPPKTQSTAASQEGIGYAPRRQATARLRLRVHHAAGRRQADQGLPSRRRRRRSPAQHPALPQPARHLPASDSGTGPDPGGLHPGGAAVRRGRGRGQPAGPGRLPEHPRDGRLVRRRGGRDPEDRRPSGRGRAGAGAGADRLFRVGRNLPDLRPGQRRTGGGAAAQGQTGRHPAAACRRPRPSYRRA